MRDRIKSAALLLLSMSAFIYIVGLNQQKWGEDHELNEESAEQERKTEQFAENMKQEEFFDDYSWYYEIYADAVALAEENGFYQFLNLGKTWISEEGHYCAFFIAEYSDSGVCLDAQSMDVYELTFQDSIYTENFAGMDYRTIEVNERKVAETEKILLQNGINERCRLCDMDDQSTLVKTDSGKCYRIDLAEKTITQAEIDEVEKEEEENWDFQEEWWSSYQKVMQSWTKITEYEKEFAGTLGGTVRYEPHLVNHIGKDLIYERYALKDLDKDGTPELILLSDHPSSMNAIFTYTDRLLYCGTYYNALYTDDGRIIERGSWFGGSAMIKETWDITEIRAGEIMGKESIWEEYQDYNRNEVKYMRHIEETEEISYEEYRDIKNSLLCRADFVRNMDSERIN